MPSFSARLGKVLVGLVNAQNARKARVVKRTTSIAGTAIAAYESESSGRPAAVFLHGLADDKSSFLASAAELRGPYDLYLPDLAGHGDNPRSASVDYSISGQVEFLKAYLEARGLEKAALIGNSMGGHVAAAFALAHPEMVAALVLVNAAGLTVDDHVVYGGFGPPIQSRDDLNVVLDRVFYRPPRLPGPVVSFMIDTMNGTKELVDDVIIPAVLDGDDADLLPRIHEVVAPTLVLWGIHDRVVMPNVGEAYATRIPGARYVGLANGSHSPQLEVASEVGREIAEFLASVLHR